MSFLEKQWKLVIGAVGAVLVLGLIVTVVTSMKQESEKKSQEKFYSIEKKYNEYKSQKAIAADPAQKTKPAAVVDVTELKKSFESFLATDSSSKAGQMAALYYSEVLLAEKNKEEAKAVLTKVQNKDSGLVNTLVQQQLGQVLADMDQCPEAISIWQKIVDRKEAAFIHNDVKIQQALCYQKTNDLKKAEEILTNIANQKAEAGTESASAKEASKYLRLIQYKKISGT